MRFLKKYWYLLVLSILIIIIVVFFLAKVLLKLFNIEFRYGLTISISFVSIFATFGGAYLGAKISGENASKLAKKESMINDLRKTLEFNNKVLDEFNKGSMSIRNRFDYYLSDISINNILEFNNYYIKFMEAKSDFDYFLNNNDLESVFPLLHYEFDELEIYLGEQEKMLGRKISKIGERLTCLIEQQNNEEFTLYGYKSGISICQKNRNVASVEIQVKNEIKKVEVDLIKVNNILDKEEINSINSKIQETSGCWKKFQFKSKKDIRDFIAKYYGEYK
ncbi:hypothetical protein ACY2DA_10720 [Staphylococcus simulans]